MAQNEAKEAAAKLQQQKHLIMTGLMPQHYIARTAYHKDEERDAPEVHCVCIST